MPRMILEEARIHPAAKHDIVVVGMRQNPARKKARKLLDAAGLQYQYLEYGSYFNTWRRRNALKLIGGADDLEKLLAAGELKALLGAA